MALSASNNDLATEIADAGVQIVNLVTQLMTAHINVYTLGDPTPYDPATDTGGDRAQVAVLTNRRCRIQPATTTTALNADSEWVQLRSVGFQIEALAGDPSITKGMIVTVADTPSNPAFVGQVFTVTGALNSTYAALTTITTTTDSVQVS